MVLGCDQINYSIAFEISGLFHCCIWPRAQGRPCIISPFTGENFPTDLYFSTAKELLAGISAGSGPCQGCLKIKEGDFPRKFEGIKEVNILNTRKCNFDCYYCGNGKYKDDVCYNPAPALEDMFQQGLLHPDCRIALAAGEPAMYDYLGPLLDFINKRDLGFHVLSNASIWSEAIANMLQAGSKSRQITVSLDSGCASSFQLVKGCDLFEQAVKNTIKYAKSGCLSLKYIINERASTPEDLHGFVSIASEINPRRIIISSENIAYNYHKDEYKKLFPFAVQLNNLLLDKGHTVDYFWWTLKDAKALFNTDNVSPFAYKKTT